MNCVFTLVHPRSVVKNKPPRKALAENLDDLLCQLVFSLIFISFIYIYIYIGPWQKQPRCEPVWPSGKALGW